MGSRGQHPGRRVEDYFARASSTLGGRSSAASQPLPTLPMPGRIRRKRRSPRMHPRFRKLCKSSHDSFVSLLQRCTRQLAQCVGRCRCGREGEFHAHGRKLWCHPCRHRLLPRKDSSSGRRNGWLPPRRQSSQQSSIETSASKLWQRERGASKNCCCRRRVLLHLSQTPRPSWSFSRASGRAPRIGERPPEAHEAEDLSSGGHARVDSSRVVSLDGRPSGGRAGSSHPRRPQSSHRVEFDVDEGSERMVEMTRLDISDDEFRSREAPGEGRFAPY